MSTDSALQHSAGFADLVDVEVTVPVAAGPPIAFAAITQWSEQGRWMLGSRVWVSRGDGTRVGDELTAWTGIGKFGFLDTMDITSISATMVEVLHTGRVVRGYGWMGVRDDPTGARFVWGESVQLPFGMLGRLGWLVVGPALRLGVRASLRKLAGQVESGSMPR